MMNNCLIIKKTFFFNLKKFEIKKGKRFLNIHEYQSQKLLKNYGILVPRIYLLNKNYKNQYFKLAGNVAETPSEAYNVAESLSKYYIFNIMGI